MNSDCSLTSVPTFFINRIMSEEHNNLYYEFDDQGDLLLDMSEDQEEPMEVAKQGEEQPEDSLGHLMCGERDIFDDSLNESQLMAMVNTPTPEDPVVPARSAETEKALQPTPGFNWNQEVEDQDSAHLEHYSVEQFLSFTC